MHQVVGGVVQHLVGARQQVLQRLGQAFVHLRRRILKRRLVALGQDPGLEREARRIGRDGEKSIVLGDHAHAGFGLLPDDVAEDAALLVNVILLGAFQFLEHVLGHNRQRDELPVGVLQGRARRGPWFLKMRMYLKRRSFFRSRMRSRNAHSTSSMRFSGSVGQGHVVARASR